MAYLSKKTRPSQKGDNCSGATGKQGPPNSGVKEKGKKQDKGKVPIERNCRNLAYDDCWVGWERYAVFGSNDVQVTAADARCQSAILAILQGYGQAIFDSSCLLKSVTAAVWGDSLKHLHALLTAEKPVGLPIGAQTEKETLQAYAFLGKHLDFSCNIWEMVGVKARVWKTVTTQGCNKWLNFLSVPSVYKGGVAFHLLPVFKFRKEACLTIPDNPFGAPTPPAASVAESSEPPQAEPSLVQQSTPAAPAVTIVPAQSSNALDVAPPPVAALVLQHHDDDPHSYVRALIETAAADHPEPMPGLLCLAMSLPPADARLIEDEYIIVPPQATDLVPLAETKHFCSVGFGSIFHGFWCPPRGFQWRDGWVAETYDPIRSLRCLGPGMPQVCSATARYAIRYGDAVLYMPVPEGVHKTWNGVLAGESFSGEAFFGLGAKVRLDETDFAVVHDDSLGCPLLRLERLERPWLLERFAKEARMYISAEMRNSGVDSFFDAPLYANSISITSDAARLSPEHSKRLQYLATIRGLTDPSEVAMVGCIQHQAAVAHWGEEAPQAESALQQTRELLATIPGKQVRYAGGLSFPWGDCYSCGKAFDGRFSSRLCETCSKTNGPVGRLVAEGLHVVPPEGVIYPGVVTTETRHPPLKSSKRTIATERGFRDAPSTFRSFRSSQHSRGVARASGVLG